ncbi:MAG TPA: carboxypeptidase M32 [Chloroflexia bacterium]|nr:carboxypeptidase M32 [Chloroflexia bacterium]
MSEKFDRLKMLLAEIEDLERVIALLNWDRETYMPPGGNESRSHQIATLDRLKHARLSSDELGRLLEDLTTEASDFDPDGEEARIVAVMKRDFDLECKMPEKLVLDISHASSEGLLAWRSAREAQDFAAFVPYMKRNADLNAERAEALGYTDHPYDALLDRWEPGITTAQLETIFADLKATIVPMVRDIAAGGAVDDICLFQEYNRTEQIRFGLQMAERFGYDRNRGRLDTTAHPFCTSFGLDDVRITTRVFSNFLNASLFAIMHETGHALYEQGVSPSLARTPLAHGASAGMHESQSRLWENLVGRSRPFQEYLFPRLQRTFPGQLGGMDIEGFYRAINKVHPSLIRVEADEVTYNLHIMLRFELEKEILAGKVEIEKLDEIWNERIREYLGITPPNSAEGVLQDIHWSWADTFGLFPGYALGNVIGTQLFAHARKALPSLDDQMAHGEFNDLLTWLQTNLYQHGRKFTPNELMERITGSPITTDAWVEYVHCKFGAIY